MKHYDADKVFTLAGDILRYRKLYYAGQPEISDADYDKLEDELRRVAPDHPVFSQVGSEGGSLGVKVKHRHPMLSLAKTYDQAELIAWADEHDLVATFKIDGISLSLVYEKGSLVLAKTRGNGRQGEDVTEKARWIADCVTRVLPVAHESLPSHTNFEVRGELYCSQKQFSLLLKEMDELKLEKPSNPRNIVAGILGRKQHVALARYFNFFAFDLLLEDGSEPLSSELDKFAWLTAHGFRPPVYEHIVGKKPLLAFLERAKAFMGEDEIGIDGVVLSYNDTALHARLGATSHHPRYKMSFKWQGETARARIKGMLWNTSRLGVVTPVAVIDPVYLSGANITNVTLHNAAHVKHFNLKVGDCIEVVRSGEVIPKFLTVLEAGKGNYEWPSQCPSCSAELEFDDVRLYCVNHKECPAQLSGVILNWIRCAGIDDLSEKRLLPLLERGLVNHMADLYRLEVADFLTLPLTKEKMAAKLYQNIQASKHLPLGNFLNGLGIKGVGHTSWELLLEHFPTIKALQAASVEDISAVKGFAEKTAGQIVQGLLLRKDDIAKLLEVGVKPQAPAPRATASNGRLAGKTFVITGTLSRSRQEIVDDLTKAGAKVAGSVSGHTHAVIIADPKSASSKAKKARELGIALWSEEQLAEELKV